MKIDWEMVNYFNPEIDEFSEDPDKYADPKLIYAIDAFRAISSSPIHPSPATGALARFEETAKYSRHYAIGRKSDAIDIFCEEPIQNAYLKAITCGLFGGVGVYFDTRYKGKPWPMLHLDLRPLKNSTITLWYRDISGYSYPKEGKFVASKLFQKLSNSM